MEIIAKRTAYIIARIHQYEVLPILQCAAGSRPANLPPNASRPAVLCSHFRISLAVPASRKVRKIGTNASGQRTRKSRVRWRELAFPLPNTNRNGNGLGMKSSVPSGGRRITKWTFAGQRLNRRWDERALPEICERKMHYRLTRRSTRFAPPRSQSPTRRYQPHGMA
jgi:hypothetical protein